MECCPAPLSVTLWDIFLLTGLKGCGFPLLWSCRTPQLQRVWNSAMHICVLGYEKITFQDFKHMPKPCIKKKTSPSAKQYASLTPHPVAKGFILAFQVPSQSSLSRFSLQTLGRPYAQSQPDERLWLGLLCQPLPAAASVSWLQKDNLLFFAWFSADSITKWDMQTGTAVLRSVIYSVPYRKIVINPWLLTEQWEHLPTSDGYRLEVTPKITPKDTGIAVRIQVMFWTFFFFTLYYELKTGPASVGTYAKVCKYFKPNQSHFPVWVGQVSGKDAFTAKPWENSPVFHVSNMPIFISCEVPAVVGTRLQPNKALMHMLNFQHEVQGFAFIFTIVSYLKFLNP